MKKPRYLTKSRFKLGMECATKLFYTKKKQYLDTKMDDSFLAALAEGGFQVGELAKLYHPGGHDITTLDYDEAAKQTDELLATEKVTIYEPAIKFHNLFIRVDVLVKNKDHFELIEVKAKSFAGEDESFLNKNGTIKASWKPYLFDIAFQRYVLRGAQPAARIDSYLMLADKNSECPVDGLNQKFRIVRDEKNQKGVKVSNTLTEEDLVSKVLVKVPVDELIDLIMEDGSFEERIKFLAEAYENDKRLSAPIGGHCGSCEFKCSPDDEAQGFINGFKECWKRTLDWNDEDFIEPNVLEVWSLGAKKTKLISEGRIKFSDLREDDFEPDTDGKPGISAKERKWLQVEKVQKAEETPFLDNVGLQLEMDTWTYPLHFIDFETSMVAIPFNKGRRPYEAIAFQFSHHVVHEDGRVEHVGEYLNTTPGEFPNYKFLREFKCQLEEDQGTIFRYSPHENTFLNHIYRQLQEDESDISDRDELCEFIKTITTSSSSMAASWEGERNMVDLWHLVKRYYYDPATHGSNSIKAVLPAILNSSDFLKKKYASPIYGTNEMKSLNFKNWVWLEEKEGKLVDPYKKLPKMFQDVSKKNLDLLTDEDELANGGAALTAYGRMQFCEMSDIEREQLAQALLRYCELDTLAMVMIFEAWREWLK